MLRRLIEEQGDDITTRESERSMLAKEQPICSYGIRNRIKYLGAALIRNRNFNIVQLKIDCLRISNSENA